MYLNGKHKIKAISFKREILGVLTAKPRLESQLIYVHTKPKEICVVLVFRKLNLENFSKLLTQYCYPILINVHTYNDFDQLFDARERS